MLRKLVRLDQRRYGFPACNDPLPWSQQESCRPRLGWLTEAKSPLDIHGRVQRTGSVGGNGRESSNLSQGVARMPVAYQTPFEPCFIS